MDLQREVTAAPAIPLLLTILAEGESPGFAIIREARQRAGGRLDWVDAMVYPLFHRMLRLGYVTSDWRVVPEGGRRRFYAITDLGREARRQGRPLGFGLLGRPLQNREGETARKHGEGCGSKSKDAHRFLLRF